MRWHPMDSPLLYQAWQAPFANRKLYPVLAATRFDPPARVLDVGCGPGTNAGHFTQLTYLGIDLNPEYIDTARRRYGDRFRVGDASRLDLLELPGDWDCILINSLLHHMSDEAVSRLLDGLPRLLAPAGRVHILDLVLPPQRSLSRLLARLDRGRYARSTEAWRRLIGAHLHVELFTPFALGVGALEMWSMIHCIASRRQQ